MVGIVLSAFKSLTKSLAFFAAFAIPYSAFAEFLSIPSQNSFYRPSDGAAGVSGFTILRPSAENPISGFAFFSSKNGSKTTFNPEQLTPSDSESFVLLFSSTSGTEIVLPSEKRSTLEGEVLFRLGDLTIFVEPRANFPYVAVLSGSGESQSVAAFSGTTEIINVTDSVNKIAPLLFPSSSGDSLDIKGGEIILGDVAYSAKTLGSVVDRQNPCLLSNTVLISKADLDLLLSGKPVSTSASEMIEASRRGDVLPSFTDKFVPLRVSSRDIVAFNAEAGKGLVLLSPTDSVSGINVCVFSKLEL